MSDLGMGRYGAIFGEVALKCRCGRIREGCGLIANNLLISEAQVHDLAVETLQGFDMAGILL